MLNLIILHVFLHVQLIKHTPNLCTCTCKHTCSLTRTRGRTHSNAFNISYKTKAKRCVPDVNPKQLYAYVYH